MSKPWDYLIEGKGDEGIRDLERAANSSNGIEDWKKYEAALRRSGQSIAAYQSLAKRTLPKIGYYNLYDGPGYGELEGLNIVGPFKTKKDALNGHPKAWRAPKARTYSGAVVIKRGPWIDYDPRAKEATPNSSVGYSSDAFRSVFRMALSWHRRFHAPGQFTDTFLKDTKGKVKWEDIRHEPGY